MAIRVLTIDRGGSEAGYAVTGYDLTDDIEGLSFAADGGGPAGFRYNGPRSKAVEPGTAVVIEDRLDVVWQGRIVSAAPDAGGPGIAVRALPSRVLVDTSLFAGLELLPDLRTPTPLSARRGQG